jgi:hypothetical protein
VRRPEAASGDTIAIDEAHYTREVGARSALRVASELLDQMKSALKGSRLADAARDKSLYLVGGSFRVREPVGVTCHIVTTAAQPGIGTTHRSTATTGWLDGSASGSSRPVSM